MRSRALLSAALGCTLASACITDRILVEDEQGKLHADAAQMKRVEKTTAEMRHLPFKQDVPVDVMTVEELRAWFDRYADARKEILAREDRFHHRMGILPPTVSTAEAFSGFLVDFVGGVYDDDGQRMILVSDYAWWSKLQQDIAGVITGVDWAYEVFLVHELTHALQDQHFALGEMLKGGVYDDNDDAAFVRKTVLESEANVIGMAHFLGMDLSQLATRKAFFLFLRYNNLLNGPLMAVLSGRTPSFFAKQTFSQYELGLGYVERRLDEGGLDSLSRGYVKVPGDRGALPESTEQLLWPRKTRRDTLDPPVHIAKLASVPASLPGGEHVLTNVFGALAFKHWIEIISGALEANAVADGWGGDRYDVIDVPLGGASPSTAAAGTKGDAKELPLESARASVLLWRTTWDSEDDAREAFAALKRAVPKRYGERAQVKIDEDARFRMFIPRAEKEERFVRTLRDEAVLIERRGVDVVVVDGATPDTIDAVMGEMWTNMTRVPRPPLDEARLAQKSTALEASLHAVTPAPERPGLVGRFFLPARTMSMRLGTGVDVSQPIVPGGEPGITPIADMEMRWGFRPHFELTLPLGVSASTTTPLGMTWAGVNASSLFPEPHMTVGGGHAVPFGDDLALVLEASLEDFTGEPIRRVNAGVALRPFDALVLTPGVALLQDARAPIFPTDAASADAAEHETNELVILGAALERGFIPAPLVEVEIVDGLFLYESTAVYLRKRDAGLSLAGHSHVLGLVFYY